LGKRKYIKRGGKQRLFLTKREAGQDFWVKVLVLPKEKGKEAMSKEKKRWGRTSAYWSSFGYERERKQ